jgi:hypothetical protein
LRRRNGGVDIGEQSPRAIQKRLSGERQLDRPRRPTQQLATDELFQRTDLAADCRLGYEQPCGGAPEADRARTS